MKKNIFLSLGFVIFLITIFLMRKAAPPDNTRELFSPGYPAVINPAFFISEILTGQFFKNDANSF